MCCAPVQHRNTIQTTQTHLHLHTQHTTHNTLNTKHQTHTHTQSYNMIYTLTHLNNSHTYMNANESALEMRAKDN